ncbi:MAG TPA: outer membrane beta-barrel protein [Burkholderiales bacterium]|nr:outer membrane beta-barrel protein [Burkholderiales bacterium]
MKTKIVGAVCAAALALPAATFAQSTEETGVYIGGSIGQMEAEGTCPAGFTCDLKDTAWKLFGGYRVNRHLAVEGSYFNLGEIRLSGGGVSATGEGDSWSLAAVGILPVGSSFSLFGKAGVAKTEVEARATGPGGTVVGNGDQTELHFGAGAMFSISRNLSLRGEWERFEDSEVDMISIGLQYRF